jgi:hypothetical protein
MPSGEGSSSGSGGGGRVVGTSGAPDCSLSCNTGSRAGIIVAITIAVVIALIILFSCCCRESRTDDQPGHQSQKPLEPIEQYWANVEAQEQAERKRRETLSSTNMPREPEKTATRDGRRYHAG